VNPDSAVLLRPPPSLAFLVFTLTFSHAMSVGSMMVLPAIAPVVAAEYGIDPSLVGYHISVVSIGLIVSLVLFANLSRRLGSARTAQIGQCLVAAGMLCAVLPSVGFLLPGSLVIGLGFGLLAPPASVLMMRFSPPARRNLVFSIQQTSVPLGGVIAALASPAIAVNFGWRWAFIYAVVMLGMAIALLQLGRTSGRSAHATGRRGRQRAAYAGPSTSKTLLLAHWYTLCMQSCHLGSAAASAAINQRRDRNAGHFGTPFPRP